MKKYIYIIVFLCLTGSVLQAQTFSNDNFVYKVAPKKAVKPADFKTLTKAEMSQNLTYFDGLGRSVQNIGIGQGGNAEDIITPIEYDNIGRQVKEFLPYAVSNAGTSYLKVAPLAATTAVTSFYNTAKYENTLNPFSQKELEGSALNRVLKQAAPGTSWGMGSGHEIKFDYQTNTATEVKRYRATAVWDAAQGLYATTFSDAGNYAANELYKTITYDENTTAVPTETAGSVVEFKNKEGQIVLKRTYETGIKHDTYYVYDIYGNLTYVIPPKADQAINATILDNLCYQYKYDDRNRMVEKKLPGKQWEFIVYDKLDRVVATGPVLSPFSDLSTTGWHISKYDVFNRPVLTAWLPATITSATRKTVQDTQNTYIKDFSETKNAGATDITVNGVAFRYSNVAWPIANYHVLTVNYYDDYNFPGAPVIPATVAGTDQIVFYNNTTQKPVGLATGTWVRVLETSVLYKNEQSYSLYDAKARLVRSYTLNHLGGYSYTDSKLDFAGKPVYTISRHKRTSAATELMTKDTYTYSAQDRLITQTHQINTGAVELITANSYDALGQLISKKTGNTQAAPVQNINYSYNIRGWLTGINDINGLIKSGDPKDLFAFKINYNTIVSGITDVKALFNGNISETQWTSASETTPVIRTYGYKYDQLNRLKDAVFKRGTAINNGYNETLTYDKNGNITTIIRNGNSDTAANQIDNLTFSYLNANSNQLAKVVDSAPAIFKASGFVDSAANTIDDYSYDANGNMIKDNNKDISAIVYNHLNLPAKITFGTNGNINYFYNATGQKVQKVVTETGKASITTDYLVGYQYDNTTLKFFPTAEGYVEPSGSSFKYVYQYKDHLGNVRLSYDKSLVIQEESNYYPFGLKQVGYNIVKIGVENKYKYNGKEFQDEIGLNMYDYGSRFYDPARSGWSNIDPLAEKMRRFTPYNYCFNNPLRFTDPDGMAPSDIIVLSMGQSKEITRVKSSGLDVYVKVSEGAFNKASSSFSTGDKDYNTMLSINSLRTQERTFDNADLISEQTGTSINVTGSMREGNNKIGDVTVTTQVDFDNGSSKQLDSFSAVAGGFGNGAPENGSYTVSNFRDRSAGGGDYNKGMNSDGVGFSFNLNPQFSTNRSDLRIHPDGNNEGTLGCIGLSGNATQLNSFSTAVQGLLQNSKSIPATINIANNPNNNGRSGTKIPKVNE